MKASRAARRHEWIVVMRGRYWCAWQWSASFSGEWYKDESRATRMTAARAESYRRDWAKYGATVRRAA